MRVEMKRGYSLIELSFTVAILGFLLMMLLPMGRMAYDQIFATKTSNELNMLMTMAKIARNDQFKPPYNTTHPVWMDWDEMKASGKGYLPSGWNIQNAWGNPYTLPDFEASRPAAQDAALFKIRTKVPENVVHLIVRATPFAVAVGDDEVEVSTPPGGAEPGWIAKVSRYPGAPEEERTMHEPLIVSSVEDRDNPENYYMDQTGTTHLHKLIVDEFEMAPGAVINNLSVNQLTFGEANGSGMYPDDIVCSTIRVNNWARINDATSQALNVISNADIQLGGIKIENGYGHTLILDRNSTITDSVIDGSCRFSNVPGLSGTMSDLGNEILGISRKITEILNKIEDLSHSGSGGLL